MVCVPAWRKAVTCIFSLPRTLQSLTTPEFSWIHCYFLASVSCKTPSCNLSGARWTFQMYGLTLVKPACLGLWYVGRGRFGVQVELCCWSCSAQPRESSCTSPLLMQVPLPCSKGAGVCLGQCKSDFSLSPRHKSASPSGVCNSWESSDSHQIASGVLTSVPISQPEAPCGWHLAPG